MAERRMFAKTIVTSDAFLDMPPTARCLYFTLGMFADDDGFVNNPKSIMRQSGATLDDMNILIAKKFVINFESGVIVIKHWRIHNYIRGDRKHDTKYAEELSTLDIDENGAYSLVDADAPLLETADAKTMRQKAYEESDLPYSFDYKIRNAFYGKPCPVCGVTMSSSYLCKPTIQHNMPISMGGKHELGNIAVICQSCNSSIQDNPTEDLNAEEVIKVWDELCQANVGQVSDKRHTEVRLGKSKDRLGKDKKKEDVYAGLPDNLKNTLNEFEEMRKSIKKPMTDVARKRLIRELQKLAGENVQLMIEILDQSILNSWAGVYPIKNNNKAQQGSGNPFLDMLQKGNY